MCMYELKQLVKVLKNGYNGTYEEGEKKKKNIKKSVDNSNKR